MHIHLQRQTEVSSLYCSIQLFSVFTFQCVFCVFAFCPVQGGMPLVYIFRREKVVAPFPFYDHGDSSFFFGDYTHALGRAHIVTIDKPTLTQWSWECGWGAIDTVEPSSTTDGLSYQVWSIYITHEHTRWGWANLVFFSPAGVADVLSS